MYPWPGTSKTRCRREEEPVAKNMTGTMTTIYIDESGHSGDMINSGTGYDFKGQPYFALAGVGLEDDHDWEGRIGELRSRHRIPPGELKSKSLTSKPKFSAEVINALLDQEAPLFVELVDKRYFICTSITSFQLLAPCLGYLDSMELHFLKKQLPTSCTSTHLSAYWTRSSHPAWRQRTQRFVHRSPPCARWPRNRPMKARQCKSRRGSLT